MPFETRSPRSVYVPFRLTVEEYAALLARAERDGQERSEVIRAALAAYLAESAAPKAHKSARKSKAKS